MQSTLINILAQSDATFESVRDWSSLPRVSAILERRKMFRQFGVPCPMGGGSSTERSRHADLMDGIERSGCVHFHRVNGRRAFWRLTDQADWKLRSICTGYGFIECLTALIAVRELVDAGCTSHGKYVPDWEIARVSANSKNADRIFTVNAILAPAMVRSWVSNWSDGDGRNCYRLTDLGREFLDGPLEPPAEASFDATAGKKYLKFFDTAFQNLATLQPRSAALPIALSSGDWPDSKCRKHIPSIFDRRGQIREPAAMVRAILRAMK